MATSKTITFTENIGAVNLAEREVIQSAADQIMEALDETIEDVQDNLDDHEEETTAAHNATAIDISSTLTSAENVKAAIEDAFGTDRTTESIKGNADDIATNASAIDALERSGSTVEVGDAATNADRDITLTIKNGASSPAAVQNYAVVGVKVTVGDGAGNDTGVAATIGSTLDTDGLIVVAGNGEQISPSNGAAISDSGAASLLAFTKSDGTLKVNVKKTTTNTFVFVHFLLPDGSVVSSTEVELNNAG